MLMGSPWLRVTLIAAPAGCLSLLYLIEGRQWPIELIVLVTATALFLFFDFAIGGLDQLPSDIE